MILLTRLNDTQIYVNAELIQVVEKTPDTIVTLTDRSKLVVKEPAEVVVQRFIEYKQKIGHLQGAIAEDACLSLPKK